VETVGGVGVGYGATELLVAQLRDLGFGVRVAFGQANGNLRVLSVGEVFGPVVQQGTNLVGRIVPLAAFPAGCAGGAGGVGRGSLC